MKMAVIPLPTGDVMLALGEDGADGAWSVTRAMACAAADRLAAAACLELPRTAVLLWTVCGAPVWFEGEAPALQRLCDGLRTGAAMAERRGATVQ